MRRYTSVDDYINAQEAWKEGLIRLRKIATKTEPEETIKWGGPAYTIDGKNVIGIGAFKSFFAIWFFQGVFLKDQHGKLLNAREGVTKALRQWRFTSLGEIDENLVLAYLQEAIQNHKLGREIKADRTKPLILPAELQAAFNKNNLAQKNFDAFNMTKKREYAGYISEAKQDQTRLRRLAKIIPMIESNIGLNDKYR